MDTCMCTDESLRCSSETITTLLISDTPIQNKKFKVWGGGTGKNVENWKAYT